MMGWGSSTLAGGADDQHDDLKMGVGDCGDDLSEFADFGDFCLMCGEMIGGMASSDPDRSRTWGSAYCSAECQLGDRLNCSSSVLLPSSRPGSLAGYVTRSTGSTTGSSSRLTSPEDSPNLSVSDRLAILSSGPPPLESLVPPLDLGARLLGLKPHPHHQHHENFGGAPMDQISANPHRVPLTHRSFTKPAGLAHAIPPLALPFAKKGAGPPPPSLAIKAGPAIPALSDPSSLVGLPDRLDSISANPGYGSRYTTTNTQPLTIPRRTASCLDYHPLFAGPPPAIRRVSQPLPIINRESDFWDWSEAEGDEENTLMIKTIDKYNGTRSCKESSDTAVPKLSLQPKGLFWKEEGSKRTKSKQTETSVGNLIAKDPTEFNHILGSPYTESDESYAFYV